jgi:transposase InsO family protein
MLRDVLKLEGFEVGRKHVRTVMGKMGIVALYRKPRTSTAHRAHPIYPYLLNNLVFDRSNQVWATDLTSSTVSQRRPPVWGWSCLSMSGMHDSTKSMLQ